MRHIPVLSQEVLELLDPKSGQNFVDATYGAGGHSTLLLDRSAPEGRVLAIDQDPAVHKASESLRARYVGRLEVVQGNFKDLAKLIQGRLSEVHGILFDLGMSSDQLDDPNRGLSFQRSGPLDMRLDRTTGMTAEKLIANSSEEELAGIFRELGEERFARRIAGTIVRARSIESLKSTTQLYDIIRSALPAPVRPKATDSARRIFQAIRIAINGELTALRLALPQALKLIRPGGKIAVISFHSLEDRIVKKFFQEKLKGCTCPPEFPTCVCAKSPDVKLLTRRPVVAGEEEGNANPRSRSAKLRVAQKV